MSNQLSSPLLLGDDEDVVEEEEVDLLARRPLEEDAAVLDKGRQLAALDHPPGGGDQRERLQWAEERKTSGLVLYKCKLVKILRVYEVSFVWKQVFNNTIKTHLAFFPRHKSRCVTRLVGEPRAVSHTSSGTLKRVLYVHECLLSQRLLSYISP